MRRRACFFSLLLLLLVIDDGTQSPMREFKLSKRSVGATRQGQLIMYVRAEPHLPPGAELELRIVVRPDWKTSGLPEAELHLRNMASVPVEIPWDSDPLEMVSILVYASDGKLMASLDHFFAGFSSTLAAGRKLILLPGDEETSNLPLWGSWALATKRSAVPGTYSFVAVMSFPEKDVKSNRVTLTFE